MRLTFRSLSEHAPGAAWHSVFAHGWPGWREWFEARSEHHPALPDARKAIRRHMPEYESLWDELVTLSGADETAARFLSFWSPPRYLVNCSQATIVDDAGPFLIRNYDLDPALNEATLLSTRWRGRQVIGMVEAMAGLSDGMNDAGLAVSLTFGGRVERQAGFGIPLILRYVLQTCADRQEAVEALRAVPSHMSYNVTLTDRSGEVATVFVAPDRPAIVTRQPWATNHQLGVEWPRHGRISNTLARADHLETLLKHPAPNATMLQNAFLSRPLFSTNYAEGFGTVFTASYRPTTGEVSLSWKDGTTERWTDWSLDPRRRPIAYDARGSHAALTPTAPDPVPGWYDTFLRDAAAPISGDTEPLARLAAFWRRNHIGREEGWSNLSPIPPQSEPEEES